MIHTRAPRTESTSLLGSVRIYPAWFRPKGFIYIFSGDNGWGAAEEESARDFARASNRVVGIDTTKFLEWSEQAAKGCVYLPGQLEDYSRAQQRAGNTSQYLAPALLGHQLGATLVYVAQLQSPPLAFSAAVAIDPEPRIGVQRPFCEHAPAAHDAAGQDLAVEAPGRNVPLRLLLDALASKAQQSFVASIRAAGAGADTSPSAAADAATLHAQYVAALASIDAENRGNGIGDLPVVALPAPMARASAFAIIYSGDGGWRDLDRSLADLLTQRGMSVVGMDVLRYYWKEKSPAVAARDLARLIRYYQGRFGQSKVVLIGFSFGADVMPFLVSRLPAGLRGDVSLISLLSPERRTAFEVEPTGWFGKPSTDGAEIAPELRKLTGVKVQCIYGTDEAKDSLCTTAAAAQMAVIAKPGGHHFDQDYAALADQILAAVQP